MSNTHSRFAIHDALGSLETIVKANERLTVSIEAISLGIG